MTTYIIMHCLGSILLMAIMEDSNAHKNNVVAIMLFWPIVAAFTILEILWAKLTGKDK